MIILLNVSIDSCCATRRTIKVMRFRSVGDLEFVSTRLRINLITSQIHSLSPILEGRM